MELINFVELNLEKNKQKTPRKTNPKVIFFKKAVKTLQALW